MGRAWWGRSRAGPDPTSATEERSDLGKQLNLSESVSSL